jgi:hypothetical protein
MTRHRLIITAVALAALAAPSAASAADRDHDHMRDSWEKHFKLNPHKNDGKKDKDRDGLKNLQEFRAGTNPGRRDTDKDGIRDDKEGAGVIKSFDAATGVLVIDLFASDTDLTGKVDSTTKIECEGDDDNTPTPTGDTRGDGTPEDHARDGADDNSGSGHSGDDGDRSGTNSGPSDNSGPGRVDDDDRGDDDPRGDDNPEHSTCTADALVAGRTVKEAKLNRGDDGPADVFHEVEVDN